MVNIFLLKLALALLAMACFAFGSLLARKGLASLLDRRTDKSPIDSAEEHFGGDAVCLGAIVFMFGFGLIYLLFIF